MTQTQFPVELDKQRKNEKPPEGRVDPPEFLLKITRTQRDTARKRDADPNGKSGPRGGAGITTRRRKNRTPRDH